MVIFFQVEWDNIQLGLSWGPSLQDITYISSILFENCHTDIYNLLTV